MRKRLTRETTSNSLETREEGDLTEGFYKIGDKEDGVPKLVVDIRLLTGYTRTKGVETGFEDG